MRLALVSGSRPPRFRSHINHGLYAHLHGLDYYWDTEEYQDLPTPHFHKLAALLRVIDLYDWVMWLDDDAFFTDLSIDVTRFIKDIDDDCFFVACKSPINPQGGWTFLNSGVFFIRNDDTGRQLLTDALSISKSRVEAEWRSEVYGMLTPGEQAHIIHLLHSKNLLQRIKLYHWSAFNARPYHWVDGAPIDRYPIVHFPLPNKAEAIDAFATKFGRDSTMLAPDLVAKFGRLVEEPRHKA